MDSTAIQRHANLSGYIAESRYLRLFTIFLLYIGQGIPIGLFDFAVPAWMAANGAAAKDIAFVVSMIGIPWSFKFFAGFIMDRYTLLAMGRRRVWIIGAQFVMVASLLLFAIIDPNPGEVLILGIVALVVNTAVVFQDVAVDGLAVDIVPEEERSMVGALASGGQVFGIAASAALTGMMIHKFGASAAYLDCAGLVGLVTIHILWARERVGERRLPWSAGEAHNTNIESQATNLVSIFKQALQNTLAWRSMVWVVILLCRGCIYGVCIVVVPLIATQHTGWTEEQLGSLNGTAQLVAGCVAVGLGGYAAGKIGAQRWFWLILLVFIGLVAWMLWSADNWSSSIILSIFVVGWSVLYSQTFISAIVVSMRFSPPTIAATQFSVYMAFSNMGILIAGMLIGSITILETPAAMLTLLIGVQAVAISLLLLVKFPTRQIGNETV